MKRGLLWLCLLLIVGIMVVPAFAQQGDSAETELIGTKWLWHAQIDSSGETVVTVPNSASYWLLFNADGTVGIQNDCNGGGGSYTLDGESLTFSGMFTTLIACADPESLDQTFNTALNQVESYAIDGGVLALNLADGGSLLFAPEASLFGIPWQWQSWTDASGSETIVPNSENYTVQFNVDGSVAVRFDCNTGGGGFTLDGESLTFTPLRSTMMMCPDGSLDQEFSLGLNQVTGYTLTDGTLTLNLADGGSMVFVPPSGLVGMTWYWQALIAADGTVTVVPTFDYTLVFNADGTVNAQLDCNTGSGMYTVDGSSLTIGPMATTLMACVDPESLETLYGQSLSQVVSFEVDGDLLTLTLENGDTMIFTGVPISE